MRFFLGALAVAWMITVFLPADEPWWIALQGTSWIAALLLGLAALPRWWMRGILVVAAVVWFVWTPSTSDREGVRVATINTEVSSAERSELIDALSSLQPDILVLVETSTEEAEAVSEVLGLPITGEIEDGVTGVAILSDNAGAAEQIGTGVHQMPQVDAHGMTVVGVHTAAPGQAESIDGWRTDHAQVAGVFDRSGPVVAAGDFNATYGHPPFEQLRSGGANSCVRFHPTWPTPVPVMQIDHVLVSGAHCASSGTFRVANTDHLGVWADVVVD